MLKNIESRIDKEKYDKFIKKYKIKVNSNSIFNYLNNLIEYTMLRRKNVDNNNMEIEMEEDEKSETAFEASDKYVEKEKELRKDINELFEKDPKFINYIHIYLWGNLELYFQKNKKRFNGILNNYEEQMEKKELLYLKLKEIEKIIYTYKLYNFDIKFHFEKFAHNYEENTNIIQDYKCFIQSLKDFIGKKNQNVEILGIEPEPGKFVYKLFLNKIGLIW